MKQPNKPKVLRLERVRFVIPLGCPLRRADRDWKRFSFRLFMSGTTCIPAPIILFSPGPLIFLLCFQCKLDQPANCFRSGE